MNAQGRKQNAIATAQRLADESRTSRRVYLAYGLYHIVPADAMYYGESVAVIAPRIAGEE